MPLRASRSGRRSRPAERRSRQLPAAPAHVSAPTAPMTPRRFDSARCSGEICQRRRTCTTGRTLPTAIVTTQATAAPVSPYAGISVRFMQTFRTTAIKASTRASELRPAMFSTAIRPGGDVDDHRRCDKRERQAAGSVAPAEERERRSRKRRHEEENRAGRDQAPARRYSIHRAGTADVAVARTGTRAPAAARAPRPRSEWYRRMRAG